MMPVSVGDAPPASRVPAPRKLPSWSWRGWPRERRWSSDRAPQLRCPSEAIVCASGCSCGGRWGRADGRFSYPRIRAAKGACLNIAEGAARGSRADKGRAYTIARGEAAEACAAVEVAAQSGEARASSVPVVVALGGKGGDAYADVGVVRPAVAKPAATLHLRWKADR
jgi:hypothetical protein